MLCGTPILATWGDQVCCRETMRAIGGMYVLNSGTLIGPSAMLLQYFEVMVEEFVARWHCMRLHGSDQAVHNYLVYTGKLVGTGARPLLVCLFSEGARKESQVDSWCLSTINRCLVWFRVNVNSSEAWACIDLGRQSLAALKKYKIQK